MPRAYPHSHLCHGSLVGFSVKKRASEPTYFAYFRSREGKRLERDTNQTGMGRAVEAARALVEKEYAPALEAPETAAWDDVVERLKSRLPTAGLREGTIGYYLKLIRLVRKQCPDSRGPADITARQAALVRDTLMTTPGRRGNHPSAHYVESLLGGLDALWQKWLVDDLKLVAENPWRGVEPPKADKLPVKIATDEMIQHFYCWAQERYGDWPFPHLFLSAKGYTGCRLMDLCSLGSGQLREGRLIFPAGLTKGRKERAVPLPDDLYAALDAFKGGAWLWENYLPGLKGALKARGWPTHQLDMEFSPQRLYYWIETLFGDYNRAHPDRPRFTSHLLRKRAFTLAWQAGVDARRASIAYGCNVDTLMRHYVLLDERQVTDDVFAQMNQEKK